TLVGFMLNCNVCRPLERGSRPRYPGIKDENAPKEIAPSGFGSEGRMAKLGDATLSNRPRVLVVDEHSQMRHCLTQILSEHYEIRTAGDAATALTLAHQWAPDLVVADVEMRTFDDFNLLCEYRRDPWGKLPIIFYSASPNEDSSE